MTSAPRLWFALALTFCLTGSAVAGADEPNAEDRAAAQVLFEAGRQLFDAKDYRAACRKFEESMRLHQATGTQLNLARCYEKEGRFASAWINWVEAKERAALAGQTDRVEIAEKRAAALESRVSFITIRVSEPVDGLEVRRDGTSIGSAQWDTKLPVDGGTHVVEVSAPGRKRWRKQVKVKREGAHVVVRVPALEPASAPPQPTAEPRPAPAPLPSPGPTDEPPEDEGVDAKLVSGIVLTVLGAGGLGVGIGFGVAAMSKNDESLTHCPTSPGQCTADGVALRQDAFTFAHVSTAGFAVGGVGLLAGLILIGTSFADGGSPREASVMLVPVPSGLGVGGRW